MRLLPLLTVAVAASGRLLADPVLVLPYFNLSKSAELHWVGESLGEAIRESLAARGVLVLGHDERKEAFTRLSIRPGAVLTRASIVKLGSAVDASHVVYGQYEIAGLEAAPAGKSTLRITARIVDLHATRQSPPFDELGALEDLATLQTHLAWQMVRYFAGGRAPSEEEFRNAYPPLRLDAIESYIRGLMADAPDQKQRFFAQAARLEPRFSLPAFQLGRLYATRKEYRYAIDWLERVQRTDSGYLEGQFLLGLSRYYTGDYARAEAAFRLVADSVPLNEVWNNLGAAQSRRNTPEAAASFAKALEGDSADPDYHFNLGYTLWKRGQFDRAADSFRTALDRKPDDVEATLMLGRCLKKSGPRPGDPRSDGLERVKLNYEESAYRQLRVALQPKGNGLSLPTPAR